MLLMDELSWLRGMLGLLWGILGLLWGIVMIPWWSKLLYESLWMCLELHWLQRELWQWQWIMVMLSRIGMLHCSMVGDMVRKGNGMSDWHWWRNWLVTPDGHDRMIYLC